MSIQGMENVPLMCAITSVQLPLFSHFHKNAPIPFVSDIMTCFEIGVVPKWLSNHPTPYIYNLLP